MLRLVAPLVATVALLSAGSAAAFTKVVNGATTTWTEVIGSSGGPYVYGGFLNLPFDAGRYEFTFTSDALISSASVSAINRIHSHHYIAALNMIDPFVGGIGDPTCCALTPTATGFTGAFSVDAPVYIDYPNGDWYEAVYSKWITLDLQIPASEAGKTYSFSVTSVPEPSTWAMMIFGFGVTGAMLRRRRSIPT